MSILKNSWGAFSKRSAKKYLDGFGNGSENSIKIVSEIIKEFGAEIKIVDFGCGNGQLIKKITNLGVNAHITGVDFFDSSEIKEMIVDEETNTKAPHIRRKISKSYYNLILNEIKYKKVEKYLDEYSNDEVHVLYF